MVFHWSLSDSKFHQVSRTFLGILAVLKNAVVWTVSTRSPTSKSSIPFNSPLVTVRKAPITVGIIVTFMFHYFFNSLAFFQFYSVVSQDSKVDNFAIFFFFFLIIITSGLLAEIKWSVCMSKSHRSLCASFSWTDAGLCIYHLFVWSNLNFLHIIIFTQPHRPGRIWHKVNFFLNPRPPGSAEFNRFEFRGFLLLD